MARLTNQQKQQIIARDKPGSVVVQTPLGRDANLRRAQEPERTGPDLSALRAKAGSQSTSNTANRQPDAKPASSTPGSALETLRNFFLVGDESALDAINQMDDHNSRDGLPPNDSGDASEDVTEEIIPVRRAGARDPFDTIAQQPKGVVISSTKKRVIGEQG